MAASETGDADIGRRLERLEARLAEADAAAASAKNAARIMALALVVTVVAMVWLTFKPMLDLYRNPKPLQEAMLQGLEKRVVPKAKEEADAFVKDDLPKVQSALMKVATERRPEIEAALAKELSIFLGQIEGQLRTELETFSLRVAEQQYNRMIQEFPEIERLDDETDPNKPGVTKANLIIGALEPVSGKLANEFFATHFEGLARLEMEFNSFEVPAEVDAMTDQELQDYASRLTIEYFAKRLDHALDSGVVNPSTATTP